MLPITTWRLQAYIILLLLSSFGILLWFHCRETSTTYSPKFLTIDSDLSTEENDTTSQISKKPVILMWTGYYSAPLEWLPEYVYRGRRWDEYCCTDVDITFDRSHLEEATAIVFHHVSGNLNKSDLPPKRLPNQLWVLFSKESPHYCQGLQEFNGLFNLTMSYRFDSDIFAPYGYTVELEAPLGANQDIMINKMTLDKFVKGKSKLFVAVISHCPTTGGRENVTNTIKDDIDVYGACGKPVCSRFSDRSKGCDPSDLWFNISRDYRFYFAAENSICQDYITEKFWRTLERGIVPVVYGGGNYSAVAPPHSYIDARDFKSSQDLVRFLRRFEKDLGGYKKFFEWKRRYEVRTTEAWHGWCDLCKYVKNYTYTPGTKVYRDLHKWWTRKPFRRNGTEDEFICFPFSWTE